MIESLGYPLAPAKPEEGILFSKVPDNAVFSFSVDGDRYQKDGGKAWPVGFNELRGSDVRSSEAFKVAANTRVRIIARLEEPLPHQDGAARYGDFSYWPQVKNPVVRQTKPNITK